MTRVVGVRFKTAGKVYYFDPGPLRVKVGCRVVVETPQGVELGEVIVRPKEVPDELVTQPLKRVLRIATDEDLAVWRSNASRKREAFKLCQERIASHGLPMKLVDVEYTFDNSKVIFYFTAEKRVDFRELVKDLAQRFRSRIEPRRIGVRDEAKILGGYGICGRPPCCGTESAECVRGRILRGKEPYRSAAAVKISRVCGRRTRSVPSEAET